MLSFCTEENCSYTIKYLNAFTKYSVTVQAFNDEGEGPESDEVNQYTAEGTPDKPSGVKCETLSSDEIRVSWQSSPLESLHGTFKGYKVYYNQKYTSINSRRNVSGYKETTANETVLSGLKKDTIYVFRVLATTSGGDGISSYLNCKTESDDIFIDCGLNYRFFTCFYIFLNF